MTEKTGRNDPCPCGSGKKYKTCCMLKNEAKSGTGLKRKFTAKLISGGGVKQEEQPAETKQITPPDFTAMMERSFGQAIYGQQEPPQVEDPNLYLAKNDEKSEKS